MDPFTIHVSDEVLDDLRSRLRRTRFAPEFANDDWGYGTRREDLETMCRYWAEEFDWRAVETRMNRFENFKAEVDGVPIHFVRTPGKGPRPIPLILSHG